MATKQEIANAKQALLDKLQLLNNKLDPYHYDPDLARQIELNEQQLQWIETLIPTQERPS